MKKLAIIFLFGLSIYAVKLGNTGETVYLRGDNTGVGVDTTDAPDAFFEIRTESDGILIPRLTIPQRDGIPTPPEGLMIYNIDCGLFNYYHAGDWIPFPNLMDMEVGPISGSTSLCEGATGIAYSIPDVAEATSYTWTLPDDATIATGSGTRSITVDFGSGEGRICVVAHTPCGSQGDCINVSVAEAAVGGVVSGGGTITFGESTPTLTLSGHTGTIARWQKRHEGGTWTDIFHSATTYSEIPSSPGIWDYRALITSAGCPDAYSDFTSVTVEGGPTGDSVYFDYTGSIVSWTVPTGIASITIEAWGAQGGTSTTENPSGYVGGKGARMRGTFAVSPGDELLILVGQMGESAVWNGGGGGGSWVLKIDSGSSDIMSGGGYSGSAVTPLVIAGGGGGIRGQAGQNGHDGVTSNYGTTGSQSSSTGGGVIKSTDLGLGGDWGTSSWGSGGGGFRGDGQMDNGEGGHSMLSGGAQAAAGSCHPAYGGTGGGGGNGCAGGGGGGGYSGGDGGFVAGGGGSWNTGTDQSNASGIREGNGRVVIRW